MADEAQKEESKSSNNVMHTSYVGTFKKGSLTEGEENGKKVATAVLLVGRGDDAVEKTVKGWNDHIETLKKAVAEGGEQIVKGTLLARGSVLAIYGTGADLFKGVVKNPKFVEAKDGKTAFFSAILRVKFDSGKEYGVVFKAFGKDAESFKDVEEGQTVAVEGRRTREERNDKWVDVIQATGSLQSVDSTPEPA